MSDDHQPRHPPRPPFGATSSGRHFRTIPVAEKQMPKVRKKPAPLIRWTNALRSTRALSIRQPWAWLIVNGYKDVENRSWATRHRGPLLIHAGVSRSAMNDEMFAWIERKYGVRVPRDLELGGIVGVVELLDCAGRRASVWHERGAFGWIVARPRRLPLRVCKGQLGMFVPRLQRQTVEQPAGGPRLLPGADAQRFRRRALVGS